MGMITPTTLRAWRKGQRLTIAEASRLFGVGHGTWTHWERGERAIPGPAVQLLRLLQDPSYGEWIIERLHAMQQA